MYSFIYFFFFFQAEDGIRDGTVTGVQTCALPIFGEGAIWVAARPGFRCCPAEVVGTGTLTRIDPTTNSVEATIPIGRSEERRVGKECRSRWSRSHEKNRKRER